jgi:hypothetical protein
MMDNDVLMNLIRAAAPFAQCGAHLPEPWKDNVPYKNQVGGPPRPTVGQLRAIDRAYRDAIRELGWKP